MKKNGVRDLRCACVSTLKPYCVMVRGHARKPKAEAFNYHGKCWLGSRECFEGPRVGNGSQCQP